MKTKLHGNAGNKNSVKPEDKRKESTIYARCLTAEKNKIINYAESKGMKPQHFIISTLMEKIKEG